MWGYIHKHPLGIRDVTTFNRDSKEKNNDLIWVGAVPFALEVVLQQTNQKTNKQYGSFFSIPPSQEKDVTQIQISKLRKGTE